VTDTLPTIQLLTYTQLWQTLSVGLTDEGVLSDTLQQLLQSVKEQPVGEFPVQAGHVLLSLISEPHEPQVWLQTCALLGLMCNTSSDAVNELARYGMLHHLAEVLSKALSSMAFLTPSSESGYLYSQLVKFIMSMIHHFACASSLCMRRIIQKYVLDTVLSALDINSPSLYLFCYFLHIAVFTQNL